MNTEIFLSNGEKINFVKKFVLILKSNKKTHFKILTNERANRHCKQVQLSVSTF